MKTVDALTPTGIDSAPTPPRGTSKKLADDGGLYLLVKDNGQPKAGGHDNEMSAPKLPFRCNKHIQVPEKNGGVVTKVNCLDF